MMYLGDRVRMQEYECGRADLVLVLPALLRKRIVHFAENDDGEQRIVVVGLEGTAPRDTSSARSRVNAKDIGGRTLRTAAPPWWLSVHRWNSRSLRGSWEVALSLARNHLRALSVRWNGNQDGLHVLRVLQYIVFRHDVRKGPHRKVASTMPLSVMQGFD